MYMTGGYGVFILAAPALAYKIFNRGTVLPTTSEADPEIVPEKATPIQIDTMRWFGLSMIWNALGMWKSTKGGKENLKQALETGTLVWALAALKHIQSHKEGTLRPEICAQQYVVMGATALACHACAKEC